MSLTCLRNPLEWALMVALVFGAGAIAQAQNEEAATEGRIVKISPSEEATTTEAIEQDATDVTPAPEAPKHWIGILGGPITPELRAHLEVPEGQGLMVREVVPDSPAIKAGLQKFDVLLRANDADLHDMRELMDLVRTSGESGTQITLEILRHGKRETVYVTPEARPEKVADVTPVPGADEGRGWGEGGPAVPDDVLRFFEQRGGRDGGPFAFRMFGPGTVLRKRATIGVPNGVSVTIQKQDDQPAHITVKRGEETWEIVGDDPGSLEQLPEDLRPFVEQLLHGGGIQMPIPDVQEFNIPVPGPGAPGVFHDRQLLERLEAMERHMQELEQRLRGHFEEAPADTE